MSHAATPGSYPPGAPIVSIANSLLYLFTGRLRFPRERIGETVTMPDGRRYAVFRAATVEARSGRPASPRAVFSPRFHVRGMSPRQNVVFSLLPMLIILGLPGFRSKLWMIDEATGDFAGLYQWDTVADAERYASSWAMRFMAGRSIPGSVSHAIWTRDEWEALGGTSLLI